MAEVEIPPPMRLRPENPSVVLVETASQLFETVARLKQARGPFALDAERASGFKYSQRAYLVQVTRLGAPIFLIDPIAVTENGGSFDALAALLQTDLWILHAATQDLGCLAELGLMPSSIFDTELAGRLLGEPKVGLSALCESWLGISLAKEHSAVDWSTRPLHDDWLNYAALDVDVLIDLQLAAKDRLEIAKKMEWANQEFERLLDFEPKPAKADKWRGMSGMHELKDTRSLAVARELWQAREKLAIKLDVSPGRLVPDLGLVAVAKEQPKSRSALAGQKSFVGRASRTYLDTWWAALQNGMSTLDLPPLKVNPTGVPNHRNWENKFPEAHLRLQTLKPVVSDIANENNLPIENLLQPDLVRQLCWQPPESISESSVARFLLTAGARPWQVELVAAEFSRALNELSAHP